MGSKIMKQNKLTRLLIERMQLPIETEWLEFKLAGRTFHFDDLGKYFSALNNEENS